MSLKQGALRACGERGPAPVSFRHLRPQVTKDDLAPTLACVSLVLLRGAGQDDLPKLAHLGAAFCPRAEGYEESWITSR